MTTRIDLTPDMFTLMRFTEWENPKTGNLEWLIRKDGCMHCEDPGCLKACPAPGAIVQYANGIVDFIHENCIGCGYCVKGCPFNIPRISQVDHKAYKCTLCSDRVAVGQEPACAKACPTQPSSSAPRTRWIAHADTRIADLKSRGFDNAGLYDPPGVGGTHVMYVLHHADQPQIYAGLPDNPHDQPARARSGRASASMRAWRLIGLTAVAGSSITCSPAPIRVPKRTKRTRTSSREERRETLKRRARTHIRVRRYSGSARINHWIVAISFVLLLLSGLSLFHPSLFPWAQLCSAAGRRCAGSIPGSAWCWWSASLACSCASSGRTCRSSRTSCGLRASATCSSGDEEYLPKIGKYNAGQKFVFWSQAVLVAIMFVTGDRPLGPGLAYFEKLPAPRPPSNRRLAALIHAGAPCWPLPSGSSMSMQRSGFVARSAPWSGAP